MRLQVDRRRFILTAGLSVTGGALAPSVVSSLASDQFDASRDWAHFASFFIASHPRPVREAIESLRREIDANPYVMVDDGLFTRPDAVRAVRETAVA